MYDGPLMSISSARGAHANAIVAEQMLQDLAETGGDVGAVAVILDELVNDIEIVEERTQSEQTFAHAKAAQTQTEELIEMLKNLETRPVQDMIAVAASLRAGISGLVDSETENGYLARQNVTEKVNQLQFTKSMITVICLGLGGDDFGLRVMARVTRHPFGQRGDGTGGGRRA